MADVKDPAMTILDELTARIEALENVVETLLNQPTGEAVTRAPKAPVVLSGETFTVGKQKYRARYPVFQHGNKRVTEAALLEDKDLQKELVDGGFKVIELVA